MRIEFSPPRDGWSRPSVEIRPNFMTSLYKARRGGRSRGGGRTRTDHADTSASPYHRAPCAALAASCDAPGSRRRSAAGRGDHGPAATFCLVTQGLGRGHANRAKVPEIPPPLRVESLTAPTCRACRRRWRNAISATVQPRFQPSALGVGGGRCSGHRWRDHHSHPCCKRQSRVGEPEHGHCCDVPKRKCSIRDTLHEPSLLNHEDDPCPSAASTPRTRRGPGATLRMTTSPEAAPTTSAESPTPSRTCRPNADSAPRRIASSPSSQSLRREH